MKTLELELQGEELILTNYRAIFWPKERTLILADLHLGKTAYFRRHGIAIPASVMMADLQRLDHLIHYFSAERLIIVGDMFHHGHNSDLELFKEWLSGFPYLEIDLIAGNHDRHILKHQAVEYVHRWHNELDLTPFFFQHEYTTLKAERITFSGHLHPGFILGGKGRGYLKAACYLVHEQHLILPAFSLFTGLYTGYDAKQYRIILATEENLYDLSN